MSNLVIPDLRLSTKTYKRTRRYSNVRHTAASGKEIRVALWSGTLFTWDLEISAFDATGGKALTQYQAIEGFYGARYGDFDSFLFSDWNDNFATNTFIATTVSGQTTYQLSRSFGSTIDLIYNVNMSPAPILYLNGAQVNPATYSIGANTGLITFTSAPPAGENLTATFGYYFRVIFGENEIEFTSTVTDLYETTSLTLLEVNG